MANYQGYRQGDQPAPEQPQMQGAPHGPGPGSTYGAEGPGPGGYGPGGYWAGGHGPGPHPQGGYSGGYGPHGSAHGHSHGYPHPEGAAAWLNFRDERFVKGLLVGAAATFLLTNENVQKGAIKSLVRVWNLIQGSVEEAKERFRDAEAELQAEQSED